MKKEQEKEFLSGILIGIIIGALIGYFTFRIVAVVKHIAIEEAQTSQSLTEDWSKHPNKKKRIYLESLYLESSKIQ